MSNQMFSKEAQEDNENFNLNTRWKRGKNGDLEKYRQIPSDSSINKKSNLENSSLEIKEIKRKKKRRKNLYCFILIAILIILGEVFFNIISNLSDKITKRYYLYIYKKIRYDWKNNSRVIGYIGSDVNVVREFVGLPAQDKSKNSMEHLLSEMMENFESEYHKMRERNKSNVIVSMATYPPRYKYVPYTLYSIVRNTVAPEKIVVTIFEDHLVKLTPEIKKLIDLGIIELIVAKENLKPHDKFYFAIQKYKENPIITIDDDHILPDFLIESLLKSYKKYPNAISARQVKRKQFKSDGTLDYYSHWKDSGIRGEPPNFHTYAQGVGGVLYPPGILNLNSDDLELIRKYVTVDDTTLNYFELRQGTKVVFAPTDILGICIYESESIALYKNINNNALSYINHNSINDIAADELLRPLHHKLSVK